MGCTAAESVRECTSTIIYIFWKPSGSSSDPPLWPARTHRRRVRFIRDYGFGRDTRRTISPASDGPWQAVAVHPNFEESSFRVLALRQKHKLALRSLTFSSHVQGRLVGYYDRPLKLTW